MARILLLSLDGATTEEAGRLLRGEGHQVAAAADAEAGLSLLKAKDLGLVVLDLHPELPSAEEVRRFREGPLLALVPLERLGTFPNSFPADDLVAKPLRAAEFLFRARRLLAAPGGDRERAGLEAAGLHIDDSRYEVRLDGELIDLTYREYELLKYLMSSPGRVLNREHLLNRVWGADYLGGPRTVDVHIRRIRSKIETGGRLFIRTIRGVGYKFIEPGGEEGG